MPNLVNKEYIEKMKSGLDEVSKTFLSTNSDVIAVKAAEIINRKLKTYLENLPLTTPIFECKKKWNLF
jgi:hypothetical protein